MKPQEARRDILAFMYAERLKSILLVADELLEVLFGLEEKERPGGLKMYAAFVKKAAQESQILKNTTAEKICHGLDEQVSLMEGYARLGQFEAARDALSYSLSRVTTISGRAMGSLIEAGLL